MVIADVFKDIDSMGPILSIIGAVMTISLEPSVPYFATLGSSTKDV